MAKSVLRDLTIRQDITVLPIHDSFIVRKDHRPALEEAMDRAYFEVTASDGDRSTISKPYPRIYPHREGTAGQDGVGGCATLARSAPARPMFAAQSTAPDVPLGYGDVDGHPACNRSAASSGNAPVSVARSGNLCPAETSHEATASALTVETVAFVADSSIDAATPESGCLSQGSETVYTPLLSGAGSSDTAITKAVAIRQRETRQSPCGNPERAADPVIPANAVLPPAFLSPANRNTMSAAGLRRLADRPLREGRTLDRVPAKGPRCRLRRSPRQ
jgi:hypothetical protein